MIPAPNKLRLLLLIGTVLLLDHGQAQTTPTTLGQSTVQQTSPYLLAGRITCLAGSQTRLGSGVAIKPSSVLTCGHVLYKTSTGWSKNVTFERGYYNGSVLTTAKASQVWLLSGYRSKADSGRVGYGDAYDRDLGGFVCSTSPGNGSYAFWKANPLLLTGKEYNMSLGYAGRDNGQFMLRSAPTRPFSKSYRAYYTNSSYSIIPGMSGGPVFAYSNSSWQVCAVNVSSLTGGSTTGVRVLDSEGASLIQNYLK